MLKNSGTCRASGKGGGRWRAKGERSKIDSGGSKYDDVDGDDGVMMMMMMLMMMMVMMMMLTLLLMMMMLMLMMMMMMMLMMMMDWQILYLYHQCQNRSGLIDAFVKSVFFFTEGGCEVVPFQILPILETSGSLPIHCVYTICINM